MAPRGPEQPGEEVGIDTSTASAGERVGEKDAVIDPYRRTIVAAGGVLFALLQVGLLGAARAQTLQISDLFSATTIDEALAVLGSISAHEAAVDLAVPGVVEDGAVVPVRVSSTLEGVEEIYVLVPNNPYPAAVRFEIPEGTEPVVSIRLRLAKTGAVYAVVRAKGRLYSRVAETRVTVGGCV